MSVSDDEYWMQQALQLAAQAAKENEVPVGAVVVKGSQCVGSGYNQPIQTVDPSAHAEVVALRSAALTLQNYRLTQTTLYVTLEPCIMCVGAMVHARVTRLVYAAADPKQGAAGSVFTLTQDAHLNHHLSVSGGILAAPATQLLRDFFKARRQRK